MATPLFTLLANNLRTWIGARGIWLAVAAALVPLGLTGAWYATHQADLSAVGVSGIPADVTEGDLVDVVATIKNNGSLDVGAFNVTLAVGRVFGATLTPDATRTIEVDGLDAGETRSVNLTWTAKPGVFWVLADADPDDRIGEIEEFNNQKPVPFTVRYKTPGAADAPRTPENLTGDPSTGEIADLALGPIDWEIVRNGTPVVGADAPQAQDQVTFRVPVTNRGTAPATDAKITLRVGRVFAGTFAPLRDTSENATIEPGATRTVELAWTAQLGAYWVEAIANVTQGFDPEPSDNHATEPLTVDAVLDPAQKPPEPPEKLTIKDFYLQVLNLLHLRILLPFIALFYAGGVIADERESGALAQLLTRPVPRWMIPVTKFAASFVVAAIAVAVGIVATFFLLFQTPQGNVGFLTTPLFISLVALFVYGAFFILLGVVVDRPYLVGIAFVVGWETIAGNFVPWVQKLTISHHLLNAINGWRLDEGLQWLPTEEGGTRALAYVLVAGVVFLAAAMYRMKRREFDV
ncbi:MAG: CARDB domain-containing protein [Methanobacteriota archaeon]